MPLLRRGAAATILAVALGGCAVSTPGGDSAPVRPAAPPAAAAEQDAAPAAPPPGLAKLPDPVVLPVPKTERGNKPYTVWGQRYEVLPSADGYREEGLASWYGTKFNGRQTSSGEVYDMYKLTAAHRSLPIPTYVRVTNLDNGKHSVVRVNDRGPFHPDRIIDLSYAAAVKLGFEDLGTARVRVAALLPEQALPPAEAAAGPPFYVRAGRFESVAAADVMRAELRVLAAGESFVVYSGEDYQVRLGPLATRREAERLRAVLVFQELGPVVVEE